MNRALFEVGERVIAIAAISGRNHGERTIARKVYFNNEDFEVSGVRSAIKNYTGWGYWTTSDELGIERQFRKLPPPATQTWEEMKKQIEPLEVETA